MKIYIFILLFLSSLALNAAQPAFSAPISKSKELEIAIFDGDLPKIDSLLASGVDSKKAFYDLIGAVSWFNLNIKSARSIVEKLIEHDVDINQLDANGNTPLIWAIMNHNFLLASILIEFGADLDKFNLKGENPIIIAMEKFNNSGSWSDEFQNIIELLLMNGANIVFPDNVYPNFFHYFGKPKILSKITFKFITDILKAKDVDKIKGAENALLIAAYFNDPGFIQKLLLHYVFFRSKKNEQYFNKLIAGRIPINIIKEHQMRLLRNSARFKFLEDDRKLREFKRDIVEIYKKENPSDPYAEGAMSRIISKYRAQLALAFNTFRENKFQDSLNIVLQLYEKYPQFEDLEALIEDLKQIINLQKEYSKN